MQKLHKAGHALGTALLWLYCQAAVAARIEKPSFVDDVDKSALDSAGQEIYSWLGAGFLVVVGLASIRPGWHFINGEKDEGVRHSKDILIGAVVYVVLGSIVFTVMETMG